MEEKTQINYLGIIGAIALFVGQFMPYMSVWNISASLYDYLKDESTIACVIALLIPLFIIFGCWRFKSDSFPFGAGIVTLTLLFGLTFMNDSGFSISQIMEFLNYGFWVMSIGGATVFMSAFMDGANKMIGSLFHT